MGQTTIEMASVKLRYQKVLYVRTMGYNMVSTGRLTDYKIDSALQRNNITLYLGSNRKAIGGDNQEFSIEAIRPLISAKRHRNNFDLSKL